jgi:hypothetical protein
MGAEFVGPSAVADDRKRTGTRAAMDITVSRGASLAPPPGDIDEPAT